MRTKFDIESTKTVGLTNSLIAEAVQPRCDLFWNNEILNTIRLKDHGVLQPFRPSHADDVPAAFKDPDGMWYGFAAPARVLLVNTRLVPEADRPSGLADLADPRWKGKIGIAKPLFGTTATHAACLFAAWGDEKAKAFFLDLKANEVQVFSGNKQVAMAVGSGQVAFGLTDTDDAMGEIEAGSPVAIVYPDRQPGQLGTLFIPNTLAMIKGAPDTEAAGRLADRIYSPEVEAALAEGPERPDPASQVHHEAGAGRDPGHRPSDGRRLPGGGQGNGTGPRPSSPGSSPTEPRIDVQVHVQALDATSRGNNSPSRLRQFPWTTAMGSPRRVSNLPSSLIRYSCSSR